MTSVVVARGAATGAGQELDVVDGAIVEATVVVAVVVGA